MEEEEENIIAKWAQEGVETLCNLLNKKINTLNTELNPICHLLALLGAHYILHVSRIRVKNQIIVHCVSLNIYIKINAA